MSVQPLDLEIWNTPPVAQLLATATRFPGSHVHKTWRGLASSAGGTEAGTDMLLKWMPKQPQIAVELACSMAATALGLPVPFGALVICPRDQLPGLPPYASGDPIICYGSHFKVRSARYAASVKDAQIDDLIWDRVCASPSGHSGAAWDELAANSDRHTGNLLYDGTCWWLFDHDLALAPLGKWAKKFTDQITRQSIADHRAAENQLAERMLRLRPHDHNLDRPPKQLQNRGARLTYLAEIVRTRWHSKNPNVAAIFPLVEVTLRSIALRLPTLAWHMSHRIGRKESATLWDQQPRT